MGLIINTNLAALFSQRQLTRSSNGQTQAMERLSSGMRINSARDDAAGLAIATGMSSQIRGLNQAIRNSNDAISVLQTADGALNSITTDLQRIRELSIQAANETNSLQNKQALQAEVDQLLSNIEATAFDSQFNGISLFRRDTLMPEVDENKQAVVDGLFSAWFAQSEAMITELYGLTADGSKLNINLSDTPDPDLLASVSGTVGADGKTENMFLNIDMSDFPIGLRPDGGEPPFYSDRIIAHEMVHAVMGRTMNFNALPTWFKEGTAEFIHGADERVWGIWWPPMGIAAITLALPILAPWPMISALPTLAGMAAALITR
ncbi:flagellin N-terminal helical domain-containing protein [Dongshaea marina]|uniref:flagellin N-terminal helical domain-containing protein n=1 Tax=Dongshaea marina TaxID=2047966 RepID=UPI000D3E65FD|nr:hypothetical protein [Dongshaea marina]